MKSKKKWRKVQKYWRIISKKIFVKKFFPITNIDFVKLGNWNSSPNKLKFCSRTYLKKVTVHCPLYCFRNTTPNNNETRNNLKKDTLAIGKVHNLRLNSSYSPGCIIDRAVFDL